MGQAVDLLKAAGGDPRSQRCVCFTETPLEYIKLLTEDIAGRSVKFDPYGIAMTKRQGRSIGVNPVWYVDITPGHDWLTKPLNELVQQAIATGDYSKQPIAKVTPFIEQMGKGNQPHSYRKEFWWEREWRHVGNLDFAAPVIVLCPEGDFQELRQHIDGAGALDPERVVLIDPSWSLEEMIARLAGYSPKDIHIL